MPLDLNDIRIWYRHTEHVPLAAIQAAGATLSADERVRSNRFHFARDRRDYILAHDLLRRSLSRYDDVAPAQWQFTADTQGKPFVSGPARPTSLADPRPLFFNLSHTRGLVACAVARNMPVGVDVERIDHAVHIVQLGERCFSEHELVALNRCGDGARVRFFELWTLKEAVIKTIGVGLSHPLDTMCFDLDQAGVIAFVPPPGMDAADWHFALYAPSPDTRLAVAARGGIARAPRWEAHHMEPDSVSAIQPLRATLA